MASDTLAQLSTTLHICLHLLGRRISRSAQIINCMPLVMKPTFVSSEAMSMIFDSASNTGSSCTRPDTLPACAAAEVVLLDAPPGCRSSDAEPTMKNDSSRPRCEDPGGRQRLLQHVVRGSSCFLDSKSPFLPSPMNVAN